MAEIDGVNIPFMPIGGVDALKKSVSSNTVKKTSVPFGEIFQNELDKLKFSSHAQSRLNSRELSLSDTDYSRLESAVNKAEAKGANESLVIMDNKAFIVNIPNKTVITALDQNQLSSQVVTNIDSAVFA